MADSDLDAIRAKAAMGQYGNGAGVRYTAL